MPYYRDGIGVIDNGLHKADTQIIPANFSRGFCEVVELAGGTGNVVNTIPLFEGPDQSIRTLYAKKWCENCDHNPVAGGGSSKGTPTPLHRYVVGGTRPAPNENQGTLGVTYGRETTFVWHQQILDLTALPRTNANPVGGLDPAIANREVTAHEAGHHYSGHCQENAYQRVNGDRYCLMYYNPTNFANGSELGNGTFRFHFRRGRNLADDNSEYLDIRRED